MPERSPTWLFRLGGVAFLTLVTLLPFARGLLSGQSLYFRDLSRYFFPLRRFIVEGLLRGEIRYWNPFLNEGVPLSLPAVSYPLDLLQVLLPDEWGFSLLLALHVPMAGLALMCLATHLGADRMSAVAGGVVYALGGFTLSTVNLYIHLHAVAWAPLVVLGLMKAAVGGRRQLAGTALIVGAALSTTGIEIVAQAIVVGLVLSAARPLSRRWLRAACALALGGGLAASSLLHITGLVAESARGSGFPTVVVLSHSVHPMTFLQVIVGGLYGDPANIAGRWWGSNFFPRGFPYLLSLYLGAALLALAAVGGLMGRGPRRRLVFLAAAASIVAMGQWAGLTKVTEAVPVFRLFRYPSKAIFTLHLSVALLTAMGVQALARAATRRAWRLHAWLATSVGALLCVLPAVPSVFPRLTRWFVLGFFPPDHTLSRRMEHLAFILRDASHGGLVAIVAGLLSLMVLMRRVPSERAAMALVGLVSADLLREGAGLNPTVTRDFFRLSPEMSVEVARLRQSGGRLFTCDPGSALAYAHVRPLLGEGHEAWSFAILAETLSPSFNMRVGIPTAYGPDLTMLVPVERVLSETACRSFDAIAQRLRVAGVAHVVSLDPVAHEDLALRSIVRPARIAPLAIHLYSLARPPPAYSLAQDVQLASSRAAATAMSTRPGSLEAGAVAVEGLTSPVTGGGGRVVSSREAPGNVELVVEADRSTLVVVRDSYCSGWRAMVNGSPEPVRRADGRHLAVEVPAGSSRIVLRYSPPYLTLGLLIMTISGLALLVLLLAHHASGPRNAASATSPEGTDTA